MSKDETVEGWGHWNGGADGRSSKYDSFKPRVGNGFTSQTRGFVPVLFFISHDSHLNCVSMKGCASCITIQNCANINANKYKVDQAQAISFSLILVALLLYRVKFGSGSHEVQHTSARMAARLQSSSVAFGFAPSENERNILHPDHRACLLIA